MKIKAISFKKFLKNKNDIYKNVNIVSKRARQINDLRYSKIEAMQNIEDSDQLEEFIDDIDLNQEKSISVAMTELLNDELEFSDIEDPNINSKDEE